MAESKDDLLYAKIGISLDPDDPVRVRDNYFRILKIPEDTPDEDVRAQARQAAQKVCKVSGGYIHSIGKETVQSFQALASTAELTLRDRGKLREHREALYQTRVDTLKKQAQQLQASGATAEFARIFLQKRAAACRIPKKEIDAAVLEVLGRVGPWAVPHPVPPPGGAVPGPPRPSAPGPTPRREKVPVSVLGGSLVGLVVLNYRWPGLGMWLAGAAAIFGVWLVWRTRDLRVAAWSAACLLLVIVPMLPAAAGILRAELAPQDTAPTDKTDERVDEGDGPTPGPVEGKNSKPPKIKPPVNPQIPSNLDQRKAPSDSHSATKELPAPPPVHPRREKPGPVPVEPYRARHEGSVREVGEGVGERFAIIDLGKRDNLTKDSELEIELQGFQPRVPGKGRKPDEYYTLKVFVVELREETAKVSWNRLKEPGPISPGDPVRLLSRGGSSAGGSRDVRPRRPLGRFPR